VEVFAEDQAGNSNGRTVSISGDGCAFLQPLASGPQAATAGSTLPAKFTV
jgi:hypothetical protein